MAIAPPSIFSLNFEQFQTLARVVFTTKTGASKGIGFARKLYSQALLKGAIDPHILGASAQTSTLWHTLANYQLPLAVHSLHNSPRDFESGAAKVVWRLADALTVETALVPLAGGKFSLCLSSQVGCAMGCTFCETGRPGLKRDLSTAEIVGQIVAARTLLGWQFGNLVFMGMGEPLDNFDNLQQALSIIFDPAGLAYAQEKVTVCTLGHIPGILALKELGYKRLGLAISLNAATQSQRQSIMPVARTWPIDELAKALATYPQRSNFALAINWCLLPGTNDSPSDALAIADFAKQVGRCMINLIPYNPGSHPLCAPPSISEVLTFQELLNQRGLQSRIRSSFGRSIMAACGQLGGQIINKADSSDSHFHS